MTRKCTVTQTLGGSGREGDLVLFQFPKPRNHRLSFDSGDSNENFCPLN